MPVLAGRLVTHFVSASIFKCSIKLERVPFFMGPLIAVQDIGFTLKYHDCPAASQSTYFDISTSRWLKMRFQFHILKTVQTCLTKIMQL